MENKALTGLRPCRRYADLFVEATPFPVAPCAVGGGENCQRHA
jgi:hypothetical protein